MGRNSALSITSILNIGEGILRRTVRLTALTVQYEERSRIMTVYVLSQTGQPLMPTTRCGKVRRMLSSGLAEVVKRCPFTIRLLYDTGSVTQPVSLGIDAGSKHIGVSATTESKVLYEADAELRE